MNWQQEKIFRAAFLSIKGIGSQRLRQLIAHFGSAEIAWQASNQELLQQGSAGWIKEVLVQRRNIDLIQIEKQLTRDNISLVTPGEDHYPYLLGQCPDAPPLLFYKGDLAGCQDGVAVVGARRATAYGKAAARTLAKEIAQEGLVVISGLARGIDSCAHQGALEADGITWAFLASGLNHLYPADNKELADKILRKGAILSEYPPEVPPEAGFFPARNRLISGSSRGVLVVEAAQKSGSLITADFALEQGREVFAVPGPIFSELSKGTHQLLRMGARLVENVNDILGELEGWKALNQFCANQIQGSYTTEDMLRHNLSQEHRHILELLSDVPLHIDRLLFLSDYSPEQIALFLLELQLQERILQLPGQYYVLNRHSKHTKTV